MASPGMNRTRIQRGRDDKKESQGSGDRLKMLGPIGVFFAESTQEAGDSGVWVGFGKLRTESSACQEEPAGKAARPTHVSGQCYGPEGNPRKTIPYQSRASLCGSTASPTTSVIKASFAVVPRLCGAV